MKRCFVILFIIVVLSLGLMSCENEINKDYSAVSFSYEVCAIDYTITRNLNSQLILDSTALELYIKANNVPGVFDENGEYVDSKLSNIIKKYTDEYFAPYFLIIIPTASSPTNHFYKITNVYRIDNKLYVIREDVPKNWTHNGSVSGYIYFIEINKDSINCDNLSTIEYGGYYLQSKWESNSTITQ